MTVHCEVVSDAGASHGQDDGGFNPAAERDACQHLRGDN